MRLEIINSLNQYLSLVEEVKSTHLDIAKLGSVKQDGELLFRGQSSDYPLLPKIARTDKPFDLIKRESHMIHELKRLGCVYKNFERLDVWDLLTIAQHYGMATRLLDWTRNPLTAMWFACTDVSKNSNAYVYILLPHWGVDALDRTVISSPEKHTDVSILRPNLEDSRVVAQDAWFTVHSESRKYGKFVPFGESDHQADGMVKVEIQYGNKQKIMESLDVLGISHQTVFPDLEGTCAYINWMSNSIG